MISFFDDLFIANVPRLEKIIELLEQKGLIGKISFTCSCRANLVNDHIASLLAKLGIVSISMGLESGNDDVLGYLKGGNVSVANALNAIDILKEKGISVNASFIIGSPNESKEQIKDTYNFIKKSNLDLFDVYILTPLPGTPVWDYAIKNKLIGTDFDEWERLDVNAYHNSHCGLLSLSDTLSNEELIALYKKFRRLRFARNLSKVIRHPMRADVFKIGIGIIKENLYNIFRSK
jgi:radical SAM superfamily enzyme YgiQ (UPF0313 family)